VYLSFANPWLLVLLPLVAWAIWRLNRRVPPALLYSDLRLVWGLPQGRAPWLAIVRNLRVFALILLLLAAAGPRWPDLKTRLPVDGIALMLVLDVSGSMAAADFGTPPISRLDAAKASFKAFLSRRTQDQLGIVSFAAVPETDCPLTNNHSALLKIVEELKPKTGVDAGTNIGDAIAEAVARLDGARGRNPVMVILSDGEHNIHVDRADRPLMPRESAMLAKALGVKIYAIDCGGTVGATPEEREQRLKGREVLQAIAETTSGTAFEANNPDELKRIFDQIDQLETDTRPTFRYRRYHELAPWLAISALVLFAVNTLFARVLWRTLPSA
jgi:Ca-activated chloride channel homolog